MIVYVIKITIWGMLCVAHAVPFLTHISVTP